MRYLGTTDLPLDSLVQFPGNARRGDLGAVRASVKRHGQYRSIVVRQLDDGHVIVAGNHTARAMAGEGHETVRVDLIECDDDEARRINLADNRTAELGGYDDEALAALLGSLDGDFAGTGWAQEDLDALLGQEEPEQRTDPDDAPEPPAEPVTQPGDLWLLGPHRLLCGDADDQTAHDRLLAGQRPGMIYTDPPYGMHLQTDYTKVGHGQGKAYERIQGDDRDYDASALIALYDDVPEQFWWGADYYRGTIPPGGSWIVWDKRGNDEGMDLDLLFGSCFELCWSRRPHKRDIARVLWAMTHGTQRAEEDAGRGLHPTQKPVALAAWFFERWRGDVVLDLYGGSGSTLIAAHQAARRAFLMEIDPRYCDVILARYAAHTGITPTLEATGEAYAVA